MKKIIKLSALSLMLMIGASHAAEFNNDDSNKNINNGVNLSKTENYADYTVFQSSWSDYVQKIKSGYQNILEMNYSIDGSVVKGSALEFYFTKKEESEPGYFKKLVTELKEKFLSKQGIDTENVTKTGLNAQYKNLFWNGDASETFSVETLLALAKLQNIYDNDGTGLSFNASILDKNFSSDDYSAVFKSENSPLLFVYETLDGIHIPVTLYSVFNGLLNDMGGVISKIKIKRMHSERPTIINALKVIENNIDSACDSLQNPNSSLDLVVKKLGDLGLDMTNEIKDAFKNISNEKLKEFYEKTLLTKLVGTLKDEDLKEYIPLLRDECKNSKEEVFGQLYYATDAKIIQVLRSFAG